MSVIQLGKTYIGILAHCEKKSGLKREARIVVMVAFSIVFATG